MPTASSMSNVAIAELCPPLRTSNRITRLSVDADARICGLCGAQDTDRTEELCPARECVDRPERRSNSRTNFSDVPTAMSRVDEGWEENECEYGVHSSRKVCTGVMEGGSSAESFSVPSCDVVRMVDGVGSNGYIEIDVMACVWAASCDALLI